jgi:hypothetical protein
MIQMQDHRLGDLHEALRRQVLEKESGDLKQLDPDEVRRRVWQKKAEQARRDREELHRKNRPLWAAYYRGLADSLDKRAREHRQSAQELEKEPARAV